MMNISLKSEMLEISENWQDNVQYILKDVFHIYKNKHVETVALNNLNLTIEREKFLSIFGPSGSGKSTLLKIIACMIPCTSGRIYFKKAQSSKVVNLTKLNIEKKLSYRQKNIGFVFQNFNLFDNLTVEENIEIPLLIRNIDPKKKTDEIEEIIKLCNIEKRREYDIDYLSGGEKQRVQLAMALISNPEIIIADEPTGNLDSKNAEQIFQLLQNAVKIKKKTVLVVTHDPKIKSFSDNVIEIRDGTI